VNSRPTTVIASIQYVAVSEQRRCPGRWNLHFVHCTTYTTFPSHSHYSKCSHLFSPHCKIYQRVKTFKKSPLWTPYQRGKGDITKKFVYYLYEEDISRFDCTA